MAPKSQGAVTLLEMLESSLDWGMRIAALGIILITGYYVYATLMAGDALFRGLMAPGTVMPSPEFQRHVGNVELLTRVLLVCALVGTLTVLARYYQFPEAGLALLLVGAALFFGMPFFIDAMGGMPTPMPKTLANLGNPRAILKSQYVFAGAAMLAGGIAQLLVHAIIYAIGAGKRRPKPNEDSARTASQVRKAQDKFLGACWELPFCRDTEKKLCPIRHAKKSCWRTGRGCYCDQNVILTLSGGNQYAASRGSAGYLSHTATISRPKSLREKRDQCLQCPVYLHRQGQKHKLLAPLTLLACVGAFVFYWATVKNLFPNAINSLGRATSGLSFGTAPGAVPPWATELASNQILMWMVIFVAGLMLIAYMLHAIEWVLYRLGL